MKFYSIIIKYRLYIGLALIAIGVVTNIYSSFWPAFLPYLIGAVLIFGHFFFGPLRLIQESMEKQSIFFNQYNGAGTGISLQPADHVMGE